MHYHLGSLNAENYIVLASMGSKYVSCLISNNLLQLKSRQKIDHEHTHAYKCTT